MSKNVGFPVMSTFVTGILFFFGILLTTLGILVTGLGVSAGWTVETLALARGILWFFGLLLFLWALLSYGLNPALEDFQRNVAFLFAVLVTVILFGYGIAFSVSIGT